MPTRPTLALVAAIVVVLVAPAAHAAPPDPRPALDNKQTIDEPLSGSTGVRVHWRQNEITPEAAQALAVLVREAIVFERDTLAMGTPPPDSDAGGSMALDVYVRPLGDGIDGATFPDHAQQPTSSSWIELRPNAIGRRALVAHELMHVLQNGIFTGDTPVLREATAEWAGARFAHVRQPVLHESFPGVPLECVGTCSQAPGAYGHWPFYQHLAERHGDAVIEAVHEETAVLGVQGPGSHMLDALDAVLARRGSSLAAELSAWWARNLTGAYAFAPLAGSVTIAERVVVLGGQTPAPIALDLLPLTARVIDLFDNGQSGCDPVTLVVSVALPAGVQGSVPSLRANDGTTVPLAVEGGVAASRSGWGCGASARLSIPHATRGPNPARFTVSIAVERPVAAPAPVALPRAKARFQVVVARRVRVRRGRLSLVLVAERAGVATVTLATRPRVRRVVRLRAGRTRVTLRVPRRIRSGPGATRLTVSFRDPSVPAPVVAAARIVLVRP